GRGSAAPATGCAIVRAPAAPWTATAGAVLRRSWLASRSRPAPRVRSPSLLVDLTNPLRRKPAASDRLSKRYAPWARAHTPTLVRDLPSRIIDSVSHCAFWGVSP